MTFSDSVKTCFAKFTTWQGRAARSEYWYFTLYSVIAQVAAMIVDRALGTSFSMANPATGEAMSLGYGYVYCLVALVNLLPGLAVVVRRLHDTGRSGWWYWIVLIPLIGAIMLLVWFCSRGTVGQNEYGADPLGGDLGTTFN